MKKIFIFIALTAGTLFSGECKYCGCETRNCYVFRCNKCKTFFCDKCRDGDGKSETINDVYFQTLNNLVTSLKEASGELVIICPECGAKDKMFYGATQDGVIRTIQKPKNSNVR